MTGWTGDRFWLSFVDDAKPEGQRFLGVCIVDVTAEDAAEAQAIIADRFPHHAEGAEWIAAATRKAWAMGCNPGGDRRRPTSPTQARARTAWTSPLHRLLQKPELAQLGLD